MNTNTIVELANAELARVLRDNMLVTGDYRDVILCFDPYGQLSDETHLFLQLAVEEKKVCFAADACWEV